MKFGNSEESIITLYEVLCTKNWQIVKSESKEEITEFAA